MRYSISYMFFFIARKKNHEKEGINNFIDELK